MLLSHFRIWVLPSRLRVASEKAAALLRNNSFDVLYLNLQRDLEGLVQALADGAPYEWFVNRLLDLKLILEPVSSWEYEVKPIVMAVRGLRTRKPTLKVWCYKQPSFVQLSTELAEKIARLTFRLNSTGKMDVGEWKSLLLDYLRASSDALDEEARYIIERFDPKALSICISDFSGRDLGRRLKRNGLEADLDHIFLPYHFTPLEIALRLFRQDNLGGSAVSDRRLSELVNGHAEFIRDYVLTSEDYDEAYFRWVHNKAKWLRLGPPKHIRAVKQSPDCD